MGYSDMGYSDMGYSDISDIGYSECRRQMIMS
jgi:hypothetical protein